MLDIFWKKLQIFNQQTVYKCMSTFCFNIPITLITVNIIFNYFVLLTNLLLKLTNEETTFSPRISSRFFKNGTWDIEDGFWMFSAG